LNFLGIGGLQPSTWQAALEDIYISTEKVALDSTKQIIDEARNDENLVVLTDCMASRGHNSEQATVFLMDGGRDKVLYGLSIVRHNIKIKSTNSQTSIYDYEGSSKEMESFGVGKLL